MAQRSPLPTNIHGCRQILGGTHARKRRADSRCRNSLAQFFLSAGGSIRVSAVALSKYSRNRRRNSLESTPTGKKNPARQEIHWLPSRERPPPGTTQCRWG